MADLIGQTLSRRYRIETSLGRGGMAEVYKVWDQERATHLALKLLREDLAQDPIFIRRFKREAQTLAKLQHPNIVRFYGMDQDDLLAFMLMDFVDGNSLRAEIFRSQGKPFSNERILEIISPICSALHYAHRQGMVHCDVKPGNILIDKNRRVLVTDFGIARMTESATVTMVGAGTPAYMTPEQARGENPTPQTDIYSLGVVLFEMLTGGERPFTGENAQITGSTSDKIRWEQMNLEPPLLEKFNQQIPGEIEKVVLKCLAKSPTERYNNVLELLQDLSHCLQLRDRVRNANRELKPVKKSPAPRTPSPKMADTGSFISRIQYESLEDLKSPVYSLDWSANGKMIAVATYKEVCLFDAFSFNKLLDIDAHSLTVTFSPDSRKVAFAKRETIYVKRLKEDDIFRDFNGHEAEVVSLAFSPDSRYLASSSDDQTVRIWDVSSRICFKVLEADRFAESLTFSPDGCSLLYGCNDGFIQIFDISTENIRKLKIHKAEVLCVAFSHDGRLLASGSEDLLIHIWRAGDFKIQKTLLGHESGVNALAFSPCMPILASASDDCSIKLWDYSKGTLLRTFNIHKEAVWSVRFSPDGNSLISGSEDGTIRFWSVN